MARYVGDQNKVVMLHESGTFAASSGAGQWIGQVQSHDLKENPNVMVIRHAGAASRNAENFVDGPIDNDGAISFYPQDFRMLAFSLGSCVDGGSPSPYTHTISEVNNNVGNAFTSGTKNPFMSFTVEDSKTAPGTGLNFVRTANGCIVDNYKLSWKMGDAITCDVDYVAQNVVYSSGNTTSVTDPQTRPFIWSDVRLHIPSGTIFDTNKQGSFEVKNNLSRPHYSNGSRVIDVPVPQNRDYTLQVTMDLDSEKAKTMYDSYFRAGSTFNSILEINQYAATGSKDCLITLSGCKLVDMPIPTPIEGTNEYTVTIRPQSSTALANDEIFKYNPW